MTRIAALDKIYECDICKRRGRWAEGWIWYGSLLMQECIPDEVPTLCSDKCKEIFDARLKLEVITVRKVKLRGYTYKIVGKRKGY